MSNVKIEKIYIETIDYYYLAKFNIKNLGLLIGGRGIIAKIFQDFWKEQNWNESSLYEILIISVQNSNKILII